MLLLHNDVQMMELNESLEDATTAEQVHTLRSQFAYEYENLAQLVAYAFAQKDWAGARRTLERLRYFENLVEKAKAAEAVIAPRVPK